METGNGKVKIGERKMRIGYRNLELENWEMVSRDWKLELGNFREKFSIKFEIWENEGNSDFLFDFFKP